MHAKTVNLILIKNFLVAPWDRLRMRQQSHFPIDPFARFLGGVGEAVEKHE
jgi:hypothetical protein